MRLVLELQRRQPARQRFFAFLDRSLRHERWFKCLMILATCLSLAAILGGLPRGRYLVAVGASAARQGVRYAIGLPVPRSEIDDNWQRYRERGIAESRQELDRVFVLNKPFTAKALVSKVEEALAQPVAPTTAPLAT